MMLGLILSIVFYASLFITIGMYIGFFFKRKYKYSEMLLPTVFLQALVVTMALSWTLILMNGGFDVNFYLNIDYTYLLIILIPILIALSVIDIILQKITCANMRGFKRAFRYILPGLTILVLAASTLIFYFSINYFIYLNMWN